MRKSEILYFYRVALDKEYPPLKTELEHWQKIIDLQKTTYEKIQRPERIRGYRF